MPPHRRRHSSGPWGFICIAVFIVAAVTLAALQIPHPTQSLNPYAALSSNPRIPDQFRFEPKPDITPYELALALAPMFGTVDYIERMRPFYDAMPPEAKRHWLVPIEKPPPHDHQH